MRNSGFFKTARNITFLLLIIFFVISIAYIRFVMPISVKICQKYAITSINNIIQNSMYSASKNIKSEDFILRSDNNGRLEYLSVNSIIVNNICAETASTVSQNLNNLTTSKIRLPLGVFTGLPHSLSLWTKHHNTLATYRRCYCRLWNIYDTGRSKSS